MIFTPMRHTISGMWEFNEAYGRVSKYYRVKFVTVIDEEDPDFNVLIDVINNERTFI